MILSLVITLVALGVSGFVFAKVFAPMMRNANNLMSSLAESAQTQSRVLATGAEGVGRVLGVRDTGMRVNYQPQVVIDLEVKSSLGQVFNTQCTTVLSPLVIPRVQPGNTVPVRFDPTNLANVALAV